MRDDAKILFDRNVLALKQRQPNLGLQMEEMTYVHTRLLRPESDKEGDYNIDLGHVHFYAGDGRAYSNDQVDKYIHKPGRINVGWIFNPVEPWTIAEKLYEKSWAWAEEHELTKGPKETSTSTGVSVILGLGLGFHLDRLIRELDCRVFLVAEQYLEFLYHVMHIHDLSEWYDIVEAKKGRLEFVFGDDPATMVALLHSTMKNNDFGIIDGCYFFFHYKSHLMNVMRDRFIDSIPIMNQNPGFFDDECIMLRNSLKNLKNPKVSLYRQQGRIEKKSPAMIVGSGPSLDLSIEILKDNREGAVVFSCGTALGALLRNGIKPDFHVELENTPGPPKFVGELAQQFDLSGVILLGPTTIREELVELFDQSMLFFRDSVTSTYLWGMQDEVTMAAPTVSNTGARMAIGLGFRQLYLVGVDLGARRKEEHHSKSSIYLADDKFLEDNPAHKAASNFEIEQPGNLGGSVFTNSSFLSSAGYLSQLLENFPGVQTVNLSDGLKVEGARPCLPEVIKLKVDTTKTKHDLKLLHSEINQENNSFVFNLESVEELKRGVLEDIAKLNAAFKELPADDIPLFELFDRLNEVFKAPATYNTDIVRAFLFRGTTLLIFQLAFIIFRRLEDKPEKRKAFIGFYRRQSVSSMADMAAQAENIMDELIEIGTR